MRVTVTGGAGYVGCVLVPKLLERGHEIQVFDNLTFGADGLKDVITQIELIRGDIRKFPDEILKGKDAVIHLAALSNDPTAEYRPKDTHEINTVGSYNVAKACVKHDVPKFIMASSCSIYYSPTPTEDIMDEHSKVNPTAPYSKSKKGAEDLVMSLRSDGFHPCFLRKGTVFGWSPRMRYDLVVNAMVKSAYDKGTITVNSGGEAYRPLVDINDVADAYIRCLESDESEISGEVFNVVHKNYIVLALAHWIQHVLEDRRDVKIDVLYDKTNTRSYRVDGSKIERRLGFKAQRGVTQAVNAMWAKFESGAGTDFQNPKYYNMRWMDYKAAGKEGVP